MKAKENFILSIIVLILVFGVGYLMVAFVKLEIDFTKWRNIDRGGYLAFCTIISILPISALWIFNKPKDNKEAEQ